QERVFARVQLVFPVLVLALAVFWVVSGVVALARLDAATAVLADTPLAAEARTLVVGGALIDIAIGAGVCIRATARLASLAAVAVSVAYLALGTWLTPQLWSDPLGVFVKAVPGIALAIAVAALAETR